MASTIDPTVPTGVTALSSELRTNLQAAKDEIEALQTQASQHDANGNHNGVQINDTSDDHQYIVGVSELTADRTVTLPLLTGNDEFVFKDHIQTLTNKTLTTPTIADFTNANHSHVSAATGGIIPSIRDISRGLIVKNGTDANNDIDVDADEIILQDSSGRAVRASSVNLTIVCDASQTVSEANKRDYADDGGSGYKTASAWHYVWVIYDGTTVAGLASKNSTLATISLPTGYTYAALVGAIYADASRNFLVTYQRGNRVRCTPASFGLTADAPTSLSLATGIPTTAKFIYGTIYRTDAGGSPSRLYLHPITFAETVGTTFWEGKFEIANPTITIAIPIETAQTIFYSVVTASLTYELYIQGWEY